MQARSPLRPIVFNIVEVLRKADREKKADRERSDKREGRDPKERRIEHLTRPSFCYL
jgi:hypothetical protein